MADKIVQLHDASGNNVYPVTTLDALYGSGALQDSFVLKTGSTMTGNLTAPKFIGALQGKADTATKLATARTISFTGAITGSGSFDGSGNLSIATTTNHSHSYLPLSGGTITGSLKSSYVGGGMWIAGTHDATFVSTTATTAAAGQCYQGWFSGKTQSGAWSLGALSGSEDLYFVYGSDANYGAGNNVTAQTRISSAGQVYGAVWNDYAEFRSQKEKIKPGYCVASADDGQVYKTTEMFQACDGIVSDTFGFAIGETDACKTPLAVAGRVLAYCAGDRKDYHSGDTVCAGPGGLVYKMSREEIREWPDRVIGIVSEIPEYETWGTGNIQVNNRIWIKIK